MKQYRDKRPVLVIGGIFRAFLGEYMAGGLILALGDSSQNPIRERGIGSGIHGGKIVIRGDVDEYYLGVGARKTPVPDNEKDEITPLIKEFAGYFGIDPQTLLDDTYVQITPSSSRPFANKYTWE